MSDDENTDVEPAKPSRAQMVELARGFDASCASDDAYLDLIAPDETPARRAEMGAMSSCGLVVRGLWRRMGVQHPILERPYRDRQAIADVMAIARDAGALRPRGDWELVAPGDVVIVDIDKTDTHVFTVLSAVNLESSGGLQIQIESLDGGQRVGARALEGCKLIDRYLEAAAWRDHRTTWPAHVRAVSAIVDFDALLAAASSET